ncbi:hypothetical protein [Saccharopolyspora gregorii]|uniref:Uncharacterized protein n=1 Tax=Saccharopolyspora gregorii TaxID=33914 RepID=A0ABP6S3I2_9PSEU
MISSCPEETFSWLEVCGRFSFFPVDASVPPVAELATIRLPRTCGEPSCTLPERAAEAVRHPPPAVVEPPPPPMTAGDCPSTAGDPVAEAASHGAALPPERSPAPPPPTPPVPPP